MSQILNKIRDVDPNNSEAVKEALTSYFQHLPKYTDGNCNPWLRTLDDVINRFPKYCMNHRLTIEKHLVHFLDSHDYHTVIEAAKCAHALQQVRPSQEKTATAKSCWREQMALLCDAAHMLIGALFPHAVDIHKQDEKRENTTSSSPLPSALLKLSKTTSKSENKQTLMCTRLRNVFVHIQAMLVEIYPVAKPVRPQQILDVIVRALSVTSGAAGSLSAAEVACVKTQALRSLDALVACLGPNLIPFSPLVFRFVMQTLKWSSDHPSEDSRRVRIVAYASLSLWLRTLRSHQSSNTQGSRTRGWDDELTSHVLDDVTPQTKRVELTMSNQPSKHLSKKAKRKLANTMLQHSSLAAHMPGEQNKIVISAETNDEVAIAALECACAFLDVCGVFLKPDTHKRFQERLVRECYNLSTYTSERAIALLHALEATRCGVPAGVPPPTQYCLQLYSTWVNCSNVEISSFCSRALLNIRLHLHCSPPSLNFSVQPQTQTETEQTKKKVSERNRAALESLLGAEKVPKEPSEVITIPDEPSAKKVRLEDADNISLSSDSVHTVESESDHEEVDGMEITEDVEENEVDRNTIDELQPPLAIDDVPLIEDSCDTVQHENDNIYNEPTQIYNVQLDEIDSSENNIHDEPTQLPVVHNCMDEEERPLSMEVAYDFPNTAKEVVPVLEKMEDENLPSTNDTDDIQITCGQVVKNSQDVEVKSVDEKIVVTVNGTNSLEKVLPNGNCDFEKVTENKGLTVEDMLADFVDEVNDDTQVTQA